MDRGIFPRLVLSFSLSVCPARCATLLSPTCGTGVNNIPDAGGGSFSCGFVVNLAGSVASGNAVTAGLIGFNHEASGDLIVTLTHFTDATKTATYGSPQTLFYRIGKLSNDPSDFGYSAYFGDLFSGDNYTFNSGASSNLWTVASVLGSADPIPGQGGGFNGAYTTHDAFSSTPNGFSSAFTGQPLSGYWQLDITDNAIGPSTPSVSGSLAQFSLDIVTAVPEPAASLPVIAALAVLFRKRR